MENKQDKEGRDVLVNGYHGCMVAARRPGGRKTVPLALQNLEGAFQTTTRDLKELIAIQNSRDDSRFSINRILHPLLFAELGIVK